MSSEPEACATISHDFRDVGFALGGRGCLVARFVKPLPPKLWRDTLGEEWEKGDGAVLRALESLMAKGYELEGTFKEPIELNPDEGELLLFGDGDE